MKRIFIAGAFILFAAIVQAQNVGIGTATPAARLQINHRSSTTVGLQLLDSTNLRSGTIRFSTINNPVGITIRGAYESSFNKGHYLDIISDSTFIATFRGDGNVGIGTISPTAKLDVNGAMKIQGTNTLEFGAGVAGKETNAGKIGYQTFTPGALDIVGAGTLVSNRKVNIFAEGGTTFNGPINVGGSSGTAGQVLTSNGTASPTWGNAAYSNNSRFTVDFINNPFDRGYAIFQASYYNYNPTDVVINSTGIRFNRAGLYYLNLTYQYSVRYSFAPNPYPQFSIRLYTPAFYYDNMIPNIILQQTSPDNLNWSGVAKESLEVYIPAPTIIYLEYFKPIIIGPSIVTFSLTGNLTGHFISD